MRPRGLLDSISPSSPFSKLKHMMSETWIVRRLSWSFICASEVFSTSPFWHILLCFDSWVLCVFVWNCKKPLASAVQKMRKSSCPLQSWSKHRPPPPGSTYRRLNDVLGWKCRFTVICLHLLYDYSLFECKNYTNKVKGHDTHSDIAILLWFYHGRWTKDLCDYYCDEMHEWCTMLPNL